jgi:hypothetical protein
MPSYTTSATELLIRPFLRQRCTAYHTLPLLNIKEWLKYSTGQILHDQYHLEAYARREADPEVS